MLQKNFKAGAIIATPKRQFIALKHVIQLLRSDHPFLAQLTLLLAPKTYALQCLSVGQTPQKCTFPRGHLHPM